MAYSDAEFQQRYRFSKEGVRHILSLIEVQLRPPSSRRNIPVSAILQPLVRFVFLQLGPLKTYADLFGVHESTVNRIVH